MSAFSGDLPFGVAHGLHDDGELMRRAQLGDTDAFALLYSRHVKTVTDFLRKRGGFGLPAESMAQEVFLRAWRDREKFRGHSSVKTYILGIAYNVLRESLAQRVRADSVVDRQPHDSLGNCPYCAEECRLSAPAAAACREERNVTLARHISALPHDIKMTIEAIFFRGLSVKNAAMEMGCSENTCRIRLQRAIRSLRECLVC